MITPTDLPPREDLTGTYYDSPGVAHLIDNIRPDSHEGVVANAWMYILLSIFDLRKGFHVDFDSSGSRTRGSINLIVWRFLANSPEPREYLFGLECKPGEYEFDDPEWELAQGQLVGYLQDVPGPRQNFLGEGNFQYGAVCVGKSVKLYQVIKVEDGDEGDLLEELHPQAIQIDSQQRIVSDWLRYIRSKLG